MDDHPCFFCGEMTNSLAGNPAMWALRFAHPDGTGVVRSHHVRCVTSRLFPSPRAPAAEAPRTGTSRDALCACGHPAWQHIALTGSCCVHEGLPSVCQCRLFQPAAEEAPLGMAACGHPSPMLPRVTCLLAPGHEGPHRGSSNRGWVWAQESEAAPRPLTEAEQNECREYADEQFPAFRRGWRRDWNAAHDEKAAEIRARRTPPSAPLRCCMPHCGNTARFGPDGVPVACWQHAGDFPEVAPRDPSASGEPSPANKRLEETRAEIRAFAQEYQREGSRVIKRDKSGEPGGGTT